ncbi:MAG: NlpC/P60 family protein [Muribaculaceae bacterium]
MKPDFRRTLLGVALTALLLAVASCGSSKQASRGKHDGKKPEVTVKPSKKTIPDVPSSQLGKALVEEARTWIGVPYVYGGADRNGADCSGFLVSVFREVAGIKLPRTTAQQREHCIPIGKDQLAAGDILFFSSKKSSRKVAHVGMYIGGGRMIHASSSRGVVEDDISLKYYLDHYLGSGRVPFLAQALPVEKPAKTDKPKPVEKAMANETPKQKEMPKPVEKPAPKATPKPIEKPAPVTQPAPQPVQATAQSPVQITPPNLAAVPDSTAVAENINTRVRNAFNKTKK